MRYLVISRYLLAIFLSAAIFPATFYLQLKLGADASLFPLYMLAIAGLTWELGLFGAISSVVIASVLWVTSMFQLHEVYENSNIVYYNCMARTAVFIMAAYFIFNFRRVVEQHRTRMEAMRRLLNVCHGCGSLQGNDGTWIRLSELHNLSTNRRFECPDCTKGQVSSPNNG